MFLDHHCTFSTYRYSILTAISLDGILHLQVLDHAYSGKEFASFVRGLLDQMQPWLVFQGPVRSGFLAFFGQDRDRTGLQNFPFWEKTEPDWEKPVYIGPVLDICQL